MTVDRGFTAEQYDQLLQPIKRERVLYVEGQSHVSQQDVTAHLSRIFGFEGWDKEIVDLRCIRDTTVFVKGKNGKPDRPDVPSVTYLCRLRLTIRDPHGNTVKVIEDVGTGTSPNLPTFGDAHDFAAKNAVSYALKRCAKDLGDQFGLSLYNKGQTVALVRGSLVHPRTMSTPQQGADVQAGIPQQKSDGEGVPAGVDPATGEVSPPVTPHPEPTPTSSAAPSQQRADLFAGIAEAGKALGKTAPQIGSYYASVKKGAKLIDASEDELSKFHTHLLDLAAAPDQKAAA